MKKLLLFFSLTLYTLFVSAAALVCYPNQNGTNWDCFGSNGNCGTHWSGCTCGGCGGSASGCSGCCCSAALSINANNCVCNINVDAAGDMYFTATNQRTPKNIGALTTVVSKTDALFQYEVDIPNRKITFSIYDGVILSAQVATSGYITNKTAAYLTQIVIYY